MDPDALRLYSESCTRILCEVAPEDEASFEEVLKGFPLAPIGRVQGDELVVRSTAGEEILRTDLPSLRGAFLSSPGFLRQEGSPA